MTSKPCGTCPYSRSTPLGIWDKAEYDNLKEQDGHGFGGALFGCHRKDGSMCRGWLADQKRRNSSIEEMAEANRGRAFPLRSAKAKKLLRAKGLKP